ncbi:BTAD domain-containing putative transcriptional regulator [Actinoplanes sp. NPDC049681]|uniref:AfsR/SARP family transcriptional regulator n=1 Tax=Actinoplanes sp. NPDC049681 TaxID=3363905 RepID=UPI003789A095
MTAASELRTAMVVELTLLGPVEARADASRVPLAPLERGVLALLALAEGRVLSTERLIDGLWAGGPPAAPRARVQGLVSSLRRKIGSVLITRDPGYLLALPPGACDVARCEMLARRAASAEPAEAAEKLREALALWHGEPLGGVAAPGVQADRARLAELRVSLLEDCFAAELALGRHTELVRELVAAVAAEPMRERLTGQLMTALYRSNRRAEALVAYQTLRERLAEELGSDPCAEVRELHAAILRGERAGTVRHEPAAQRRPAQVPAGVGYFAGRESDLAALTAALPDPDADPRVVLVSGAGGLGKTALTVRWAHSVAHRFPDGQIFVDLHGSVPKMALSPDAAVGAALLALGVPVAGLPAGVEERAALFRTRLYHRRVLLVADDAGSVAQVLPLVPPTSGSLLVVTSRSRLTALAAHHEVRTVGLRPLLGAAARDLLGEIVGRQRLSEAGGADLVDLCGGWPLTLRQAGATLVARSTQSLSSFAEELRDRADTLSVADDPRTVRAALTQARTGLDRAAGRLFDQLGALPVGSVSLDLAAAVAGISVSRTRRLLDEIISVNLMVETGPDRYGWYEVVRRYARRCGAALTDREVAEERAVRWYLSTFERLTAQPTPDPGFVAAQAGDLPALARWVTQRGDPRLTTEFVGKAYAVSPAVGVEACEAALAAALSLGDDRTIGAAHTQLGSVLLSDPARADEAAEHLSRAVRLLGADQRDHLRIATFGLGTLMARQGRPAEAGSLLERTLDLLDPGREPLASTVALFAHADLLVRAGSPDRGQERFAQALIMCEAATGTRFSRGRLVLNPQVGARFLAYLGDSLEAPRVSTRDRRLARRLFTGVRR